MSGIKVEENSNNNPRQLVNRFIRKVKKSGILLEAKEKMYRKRPLSDKLKKRKALRREELRKYYEKLKKLGKL